MKTLSSSYHPESYWSTVAERIKSRGEGNIVAGDDSPYYRYKRKEFLKMLLGLELKNKQLMELGSGPGGNIKEILAKNPKSITGADISQNMIELAQSHIEDQRAFFEKINGLKLPFEDENFDLVFSATVLQHNTDDEMMKGILREMCRVSKSEVVLFERIENNLKGDDLCMGRPVAYYQSICEEEGFELKKTDFINIQISYLVSGTIRKLFNAKSREEGQALSGLSRILQSITLPITSILDKIFTSKRDLGRLHFIRK